MEKKKLEIKHFKVKKLPSLPDANSVYYILDQNLNVVRGYITDLSGVPIKFIDLTSAGVENLTGTGVTGTAQNPRVDIATFVSSQIGNLISLSTNDGKLVVKPITSPDSSISITTTPTELQIELSDSISNTINSAIQSGDNISELVNDAGYLTEADVDGANLTYVSSPTNGTVQSSTGTDAIIPLADNVNAGLISAAEKANITSAVQPTDLSEVAFSGDYEDLNNIPTEFIPTPHTHNISDISGTKTGFDNSLTDGNFLFVGDITQYTNEQAQDSVGNILIDSETIDLTYNDAANTISADLKLNSIDSTHLADNINISEFINDSNYEVTSNKSSSYTVSSTDTYPNTKALVDGLGISNIANVWVETNGNDSTAELGNKRKPYLTIDAALDALPSTGGVVNIGIGTFFSPLASKIKSNTVFKGSGKPITNSVITMVAEGSQPTITSPTKLIGGTILLGTFDGSLKDGIEVRDLGVDSGLDYCTAYTDGVAKDALIFGQLYNLSGGLPSADGIHQLQTNSPPRTGIVVSNITVLCKEPTALCHAMLIENTINAKVSNVSTFYGTHGLVIKSIGCKLDGLDAHGHAANGLIFKSNDYAYGQMNTASNVYVTSIVGADGGGIHFMSEQSDFPSLHNSLTNFKVEYTWYGIKNTNESDGNIISNGSIYKTAGVGINVNGKFTNSIFSNIDQRAGTTGVLAVQDNASFQTTLQFNGVKTAANSVKGFNLTASNVSHIYTSNCYGDNNGVGSNLSGDIRGDLVDVKGLTGTIAFDNSSSNDFFSSIDVNGKINKSLVKVSSTGLAEFPVSPKAPGYFINTDNGTADAVYASTPLSSQRTVEGFSINAGGGSGDYYLENFRNNSGNYGVQRISYFTGSAKGKVYKRVDEAGVWTDWKEVTFTDSPSFVWVKTGNNIYNTNIDNVLIGTTSENPNNSRVVIKQKTGVDSVLSFLNSSGVASGEITISGTAVSLNLYSGNFSEYLTANGFNVNSSGQGFYSSDTGSYFSPQTGGWSSIGKITYSNTESITNDKDLTSKLYVDSKKNESGQVKVNYTGLSTTNFVADTIKTLDINTATPTIVSSPTTTYPKSTPNNYGGFFASSRGSSPTGRLIENPINGQVHTWRVQIGYSNKASGSNGALDVILSNPVSGFQYIMPFTLPSGRTSGTLNLNAITIADGASIPSPNGYILQAVTSFTDANLTLEILSITRISQAVEII